MQTSKIYLNELAHLTELFNFFSSGRHLNRSADAVLWHELEQQAEQYQHLFAKLGFELRIDGRGFAWFHDDDANPNINKQSRQLALLLMVIFDHQADRGRSLGQFYQWMIDNTLLDEVYEKHQELLDTEELDQDALAKILDNAVRKGFAAQESNHWRLLPSVYRYLDHFEAITEQTSGSNASAYEEDESC
ncbi:condensin complex protein MksE [Photobacterium swingsii]|uniref:condensin complex protein MksE n=1 Tax=Photobacterium swingsii TaxID=680026 RepID=UPI00406867F1